MNPRIAEERVSCSFESDAPSVSPYIKELKTRLSDLVEKEENSHVEYLAGAVGDALYNDNDVAIQMMVLPAGAQFPNHTHPEEKEWLIIIKGSAVVWLDGVERQVGPRDHIVIEPGQVHSGQASEELWHIAISIPADAGYPNVAT